MAPMRTIRIATIVVAATLPSITALERATTAAAASPLRPPARVAVTGPGPVPPRGGRAVRAAPAYGTYAWPVQGPVIRPFQPPPDPYSAGHRGIDIAAPFGTEIVAAQDGTVAFAGWVGGVLDISIDHPDGVRTTYDWLSTVSVRKGQRIKKGDPIGFTGHGHPEIATPQLHFGARIGPATYIDPMLLLTAGSVVGLIHLAPVPAGSRMHPM